MRLICDVVSLKAMKREVDVMCIINEEIISMMDGMELKEKNAGGHFEGETGEMELESDEEVAGHLNHKISL